MSSLSRYKFYFGNSSDKPQFRIKHIRTKRGPAVPAQFKLVLGSFLSNVAGFLTMQVQIENTFFELLSHLQNSLFNGVFSFFLFVVSLLSIIHSAHLLNWEIGWSNKWHAWSEDLCLMTFVQDIHITMGGPRCIISCHKQLLRASNFWVKTSPLLPCAQRKEWTIG